MKKTNYILLNLSQNNTLRYGAAQKYKTTYLLKDYHKTTSLEQI